MMADLLKRKLQMSTVLLVRTAIRRGILTRPRNCPECGKNGRIVAHHEDYNKPYEVIWYCHACHSAYHRVQRENGIFTVIVDVSR